MKEIFDDDLYNIEWRDIENAEMDYENYLDDVEGFFKEDFEDEEEINSETINNMKELEELTREIWERLPRLIYEDEHELFDESNGYRHTEKLLIPEPPMLNDILEWHNDYYSKNSHFEVETFSAEGVKYSIGCFYSYDSDDEIEKYFWNLSKIYLKDQSPELIKFLHSLIKTKQ